MTYLQPEGKKLYLILWGGTLLIGIIVFFIGYKQQLSEKELLKNPALALQKTSGETINKLLLSADDLTIAEKKSFISLYLKTGDEVEATSLQKRKDKRTEIYKLIFQRKVNKLNNNSEDDFFIKPVPKQ